MKKLLRNRLTALLINSLEFRLGGITSHLPACWLSGMASSFIEDGLMDNLAQFILLI
jgi:hypothetical protein